MAEDSELPPANDDSSSTSEELLPIENLETYFTASLFNYRDLHSFDRIMKAIFKKDFAKVKRLVEKGYNVRSIDNMGNTILHIAAFCYSDGKPEILEYLLSLDEVEKNARNFQGQTPLLMSTKDHLEKPSEMLIEAGADVTIASLEEVTPLHYAVRFSEKLTQKLILAGADIDHVDYSGDTPLHDAVAFGGLEVVCMLLYYGADSSISNSSYMTPFMLSLAGGLIPLALELFEYVTDFNLTTKENMSTLFLAITSNFPRIIDMCERGADINWIGERPSYNLFNLQVFPRPKEFRYLWSRFDCDNWPQNLPNILLLIVLNNNLRPVKKFKLLKIIFEDDDIKKITSLLNNSRKNLVIYRIVHMLFKMGVSEDVVHTLIASMLVCNAPVGELDLDMVYEHYGYCDTFKLLLHMDVDLNERGLLDINIFPSFIYSTSSEFEREILTKYCRARCPRTLFDVVDFERILEHFVCPEFKRIVLSQCISMMDTGPEWRTCYKYVSSTPNVPLLQDLARNKSRDFICKYYNVTSCCKFYTILQSLSLPVIVKKLIALEVPLYKQELTQEYLDFRDHLKSCRKMTLILMTH